MPIRRLTLVLVVILLQAPASGRADPAPRPNIVFIMADDHASPAISAYGGRLNQTPHIDRIAREGVRLDRCLVTNSICTPSRAAILTGQYAHTNGVPVFNRFDGRRTTVAQLLQQAGYHTGMIGKWHLGSEPTGFDDWTILPGQGDYHDPVFYAKGRGAITVPGYCTDVTTDLALRFLADRPRDRPFFLMLHHKAPHRPWEPLEADRRAWTDRPVPLPATFDDGYQTRADAAREATMRIERDLTRDDLKADPPSGLDPVALKRWRFERYMRDYLACIDAVDRNVGRVLDALDKGGLTSNTLVIYTSDQGFFLGDHGWFDKRFMYEESLRMPFVARWPGVIPSGTTSAAMVLNVDFAPTFLAAAGLPVPTPMQGRSALDVLRGATPATWRRSMYYRYYHYPEHHRVQPHLGVRTERYKLIHYDRIDQWELFDLQTDPHEVQNLYANPAHAGLVAELKAELARLKAELGDTDQFVVNPPQSSVDGPPTP